MNTIELSQELTSVGVLLSEHLKKTIAMARSQIKAKEGNSFYSRKIEGFIESSKKGWVFKSYNFENLKKLLDSLLKDQQTYLADLNDTIEMHANLMQLILEMQSVIIINNDEYVWSKFMEYRNILVFYSFFITSSKEHAISFSEEAIQHFLKLKDLVDFVLKATSSHIGLTNYCQAETIN